MCVVHVFHVRLACVLCVLCCVYAGPNAGNETDDDDDDDYLTIMPKLRSTYDERHIHKTSYEGRKAFLGYNSLAKS